MNMRESTASGRPIIPIFANKKKKLRQALYANPSQELPSRKKESSYKKCSDEFSTEIDDSLELFTAMDQAMSTVENSTCKENNFPAPSKSNNCNSYSSNFSSKMSTFTNRAEWGGQNSRKSSTGRSLDYCTSSYSKTGAGSAPKLMKHPNTPSGNNESRQFTFAKVSTKSGLPVAVSPAKGSLPPGRATQPAKAATHTGESKTQEESKKYNRQVNLLKSPVDHSMKLITATVTGIKHWNQYRDQITILFEVFGTLDSALSSNGNGTAKSFLIKDETGSLRCTFWQMDRTLPRLIRGQMHRTIGAMDRRTETFNCVSIRPIIPAERRLYWKYIELSDQAMKEHLAVLKEH